MLGEQSNMMSRFKSFITWWETIEIIIQKIEKGKLIRL